MGVFEKLKEPVSDFTAKTRRRNIMVVVVLAIQLYTFIDKRITVNSFDTGSLLSLFN
jgi:hypothetical protein